MKILHTPLTNEEIDSLSINDNVLLSGKIYTGRDAVLPKIAKLIQEGTLKQHGIDLQGSVIFHTAVSVAGVGPTSSNKLEIEGNFPILNTAGVKIHLGKGKIKEETIQNLDENHSVYAIIPPVTALLEAHTLSKRVVAFEELGMEAFYELEVKDYPLIIAAAHGTSIYNR